MTRNIVAAGQHGFFRRVPIVFHLIIVGGLLSVFQLSKNNFVALLINVNEQGTFNWITAAGLGVLLVGYIFILILLASTKVLVDWLVDGK